MVESDIFNFPKEQLLPLLSDIASEKVADFYVRYDHQKNSANGIMGEFLIPNFTCRIVSGDTQEFTIFIRRRKKADRGRLQAHHYTFLSQSGVSIPRLYGVLLDSHGREVLFLEHLDEIKVTNDEFLLIRIP